MTYNGKVHNGVVVLDNGAQLPEGTQVRVEPLDPPDAQDVPTLYEQLQPLVGSVEGLPPDMAANHDRL